MGGWEEQIPYDSLPPAKGSGRPSSSPPSYYATGGSFYESGGTGYDLNSYNQGYNSPTDGSGQLFPQTTGVRYYYHFFLLHPFSVTEAKVTFWRSFATETLNAQCHLLSRFQNQSFKKSNLSRILMTTP